MEEILGKYSSYFIGCEAIKLQRNVINSKESEIIINFINECQSIKTCDIKKELTKGNHNSYRKEQKPTKWIQHKKILANILMERLTNNGCGFARAKRITTFTLTQLISKC